VIWLHRIRTSFALAAVFLAGSIAPAAATDPFAALDLLRPA